MELEGIMLSAISQAVEKQIPYDISYNWNLMNKINKKNRSKDMEHGTD